MTRFVYSLLIAICLLPCAAQATKHPLVGTWSLVSVTWKGKTHHLPRGATLTLTYRADGTWRGTLIAHGVARAAWGTWTVRADRLITVDQEQRVLTTALHISGPVAVFIDRGETTIARKLER